MPNTRIQHLKNFAKGLSRNVTNSFHIKLFRCHRVFASLIVKHESNVQVGSLLLRKEIGNHLCYLVGTFKG